MVKLRKLIKNLRITILALFVSVFLTGCGVAQYAGNEANFDSWYKAVSSFKKGTSSEAVLAEMGQPQRYWVEEGTMRMAFYYCSYGLTKSVSQTLWFSKDFGLYSYGSRFNGNQAISWSGKDTKFDCHSNAIIDWAAAPEEPKYGFGLSVTEYNIDRLKITTESKITDTSCYVGTTHKITLEGAIGPDSSFAISKLLSQLDPCLSANGLIMKSPTVSLKSQGGLLEHGYLLGNTLRDYGVTVIIESGEMCASSCAVAFLGGTKRIIETGGEILFHAPYKSDRNSFSSRRIDCRVGEEALEKLKTYYETITDPETGKRLFDRTMQYCSADDGWILRGGASALLFGVAN